MPHAQSAVLSRNLVDVAVALAAVLGSRTAEMLVTQRLIIHGPRASRLAKVGSEELCVALIVLSPVTHKHTYTHICIHKHKRARTHTRYTDRAFMLS